LNYPLHITFKVLALAHQLSITDATGNLIFYVKQKAFKLKDSVTVFADAEQTRPLFAINADRVLDFSASFHFTDMSGRPLGSVKRQGRKSLWKAHYEISDGQQPYPALLIKEENPWSKVFDAMFSELPLVGIFTGYVFNPSYLVSRPDGTPIMRLKKERSFFGRSFSINLLAGIDQTEELRIMLGLIMMILLERHRG
jgi:uncharacterized protein YxjI